MSNLGAASCHARAFESNERGQQRRPSSLNGDMRIMHF